MRSAKTIGEVLHCYHPSNYDRLVRISKWNDRRETNEVPDNYFRALQITDTLRIGTVGEMLGKDNDCEPLSEDIMNSYYEAGRFPDCLPMSLCENPEYNTAEFTIYEDEELKNEG